MPALVARVGYRTVLTTAFVLTGAGLGVLAATVTAGYGWYAAGLVVTGLGVTLALPALTIAITSALPPSQAGIGGGLQSTTRELGSALGVAVVGTVVASQFPRTGPVDPLAAAGYGHAVAVALVVAAAVVLAAGALVVAEMTLAARRTRPVSDRGGAR